ncbi:putative pentatricopeptide repeat-containing protein At1g69350, mitochondrial [Silene latifolia]|uniref:putative pentatricopeptide repeat-containing protein At1g69350, mitochondrial n=1 Tax=Silene latifolia TaxID=37657 RepID=UPI003D786ADA
MNNHPRFSPLISPISSLLKPQFSSLFSTSSSQFLSSTTVDLLPLLSSIKSLNQTKQSHALALVYGSLPSSVSLSASLILNYAKFGSPLSSQILFESTVFYCRTTYLWNTLLRGFAIAGVDDVFCVYNRMIRTGVRPDDHTFPSVFKACADRRFVEKGREVHGFAIKAGFDRNVYLGNTLMLLYSGCGYMGSARKVFEGMPERDAVSWNTMIGALCSHGRFDEAVGSYLEMKARDELLPNAVSVVSVLPACAELKDEVLSRVIHGYVVKVGTICQVRVGNAFVDVYGKCGKMTSAVQVFDEIAEKNVVSWNAIITSFAHTKCYADALRMFRLMIESKVKLDGVTISSMLPVVVELEYFDVGKELHGISIRKALDSDLFILNSLIDMYAKSGHIAQASGVFDKISKRNVVTWNAMVANFARNNKELAAIGLVKQMQAVGETPNCVTFTNVLPACARIGAIAPGKEIHARCIRNGIAFDIFVSNALIDMYTKCGFLNLAQNVFDNSLRDQVSYNTLIVGYSQSEECLKSLYLFEEMGLIGLERDTVCFVGAISACANSTSLKPGKEIHGFVMRRLLHTHPFVSNALLDLYMKCGKIDIAQEIFERNLKKDVVSWNTMILGYGMLGKFEIAINLFEAMRENTINPDSISYIAVLSACSHGGFVEKGKKYFDEMQAKNIKPTHIHYTCMVDLLGRAGLMQEALDLIRDLPFEPDAHMWGALLGASRLHGNIDVARLATKHLFVLQPEHSGYYVLFSNMLSEAGRWDEATEVRDLMKSRGVRKDRAYSWVRGRGKVHAFMVGEEYTDRSGLDSSLAYSA